MTAMALLAERLSGHWAISIASDNLNPPVPSETFVRFLQTEREDFQLPTNKKVPAKLKQQIQLNFLLLEENVF